ncbi:MAG: 2-oxoacid:acceptor oxidoreductase subunit alpha [Bacillota bacterium]|nr:MAG: 2-oxoacid:acceptor oxidoreductase subunit alpha [Bacillota bacterium]
MQGNEACAKGAIDAGVRFFAGYPITPSSEIAEILAHDLPSVGGKFIQMEDEIGSMAAVIGASLTGVKAMTATSGPGFSLKQENIGYAAMAEVPCLIVLVQRAGPSTGLPTSPAQGDAMQARWGTHGDHPVIVMAPASVRETYDLTLACVNWSEILRVPAILLMDEVVAHMRENVTLPDPRELDIHDRPGPTLPPGHPDFRPYLPGPDDVPPMAPFGQGYRYHVTGLHHDERGYPVHDGAVAGELGRRLLRKLERREADIARVEWVWGPGRGDRGPRPPDGWPSGRDATVVVSFGSTARSAEAACDLARSQGREAILLRLVTLWPFPDAAIVEAARKVAPGGEILVVEMNFGQVVREVARAAAGQARVRHFGYVSGQLIPPDEIAREIGGRGRTG